MNTAEIRQRFVDFYEEMGYQSLPTAPMIDPSIPMSFVMSAGLVQVENSLAKATNREGNKHVLVQNCFRHFDINKVGTDDIHLSLFEMPGAFVFGPDGRNYIVQRMWKLATDVLEIDRERIWVSFFKGGQVMGNWLPEDIVTRDAWMNMGIPENRIIGLGTDSNYWIQGKGVKEIGVIRKCGPNTELFYDRGSEMACSKDCKPGCRCGRFIEFSNSLFISSEIKQNDGHIRLLENPFTETVIGAERVSMICQKGASIFEIEELKSLIDTIDSLIHCSDLPRASIVSSERVVADHMRGLLYLIADGAPPPGKDGRARIIRMLIRRVITRQIMLGIESDVFLPTVLECIMQLLPKDIKVLRLPEKLTLYFYEEFRRFSKTIERGIHQLSRFIKENSNPTLTDSQIITLEKQWGLPALLICMELNKKGSVISELKSWQALNIASDPISLDGRLQHVNG
jgi:alanyl-tRNA synthetase